MKSRERQVVWLKQNMEVGMRQNGKIGAACGGPWVVKLLLLCLLGRQGKARVILSRRLS